MHHGAGILSLSVGLDGMLVSGSGSGQVTVCRRGGTGGTASIGHMHSVTTQARGSACMP